MNLGLPVRHQDLETAGRSPRQVGTRPAEPVNKNGLCPFIGSAEIHGGSVVAESAGEGKGATFIVKLPLSIVQIPIEAVSRVHPTATPVALPANTVRLDRLRVVVVDDDQDAVDLASAFLSAAGATVRACLSARMALEILSEWLPDVLVSDIEMPEEDGYSLIRKVRALDADRGGKTPAVALSAYGRMQDRVLSLTVGYNMHVPKPVDPGELTAIVASLAGRAPDAICSSEPHQRGAESVQGDGASSLQ